jgi:methionyl-tRNA formyltransferase
MRIVMISATKFGQRCLEAAAALPGCEVAGVLTAPENFSISYRPQGVRNVLHADFQPAASRLGAPVHVMTGHMSEPEIVERFRAWRPDLTLVVGWYHLVPGAIREIAPALGLHASLLPDYAGGAPLVWAMINGERKTGITLFRLDDGVDTGPIVAQAEEPIHDDDTIATLYARIEQRGIELLDRHLPQFQAGDVRYRLPDPSARRVFPQRGPEDGRIQWSWPARRIYDFVRAQTRPYPGAFCLLDGDPVRVWAARILPAAAGAVDKSAPGQMDQQADPDGTMRVACGAREAIGLVELEYGGRPMSGAEFLGRHGLDDQARPRILG